MTIIKMFLVVPYNKHTKIHLHQTLRIGIYKMPSKAWKLKEGKFIIIFREITLKILEMVHMSPKYKLFTHYYVKITGCSSKLLIFEQHPHTNIVACNWSSVIQFLSNILQPVEEMVFQTNIFLHFVAFVGHVLLFSITFNSFLLQNQF